MKRTIGKRSQEMQATNPYTMDIETSEGVTQHPFHLGTDKVVAETFVKEQLKKEGVRSVALRKGGKIVGIYDLRSFND